MGHNEWVYVAWLVLRLRQADIHTVLWLVSIQILKYFIMSILQLSLKSHWFDLTKKGIKKEDYRDINDYWCRRFLSVKEKIDFDVWSEMVSDLSNQNRKHKDIQECLSFFGVTIKKFDANKMTLGYPRSTDSNRILNLENKGITIGTGNTLWGAIPNKLYFIIKHGAII